MPVAPRQHRPAHYKDRAQKDRERGSASKRGYDREWEKASKAWLAAHPLCACDDCKEGELRVTAANMVDHIVPISVAPERRLDPTNFRSMDGNCHRRHTNRQMAHGHLGMRVGRARKA